MLEHSPKKEIGIGDFEKLDNYKMEVIFTYSIYHHSCLSDMDKSL